MYITISVKLKHPFTTEDLRNLGRSSEIVFRKILKSDFHIQYKLKLLIHMIKENLLINKNNISSHFSEYNTFNLSDENGASLLLEDYIL